ncbi:MAG: propionyl-CoA carboxylase [Alphaproteobacteria bacterium]|nr:propionyl-CoA carboxylase [Alphaproteobacteria bacterium]
MSWGPEVEELKRRRAFALELGGKEGIERQHAEGRLTARERIDRLVDKGSWRELGMLAGKAEYDKNHRLVAVRPSNTIIGTARLDGRKVSIDADDFTVRGGSSEATVSEKWIYSENYAFEHRMPLIRLVESAGGSVRLVEQQGSTKIPGYPTWQMVGLLGYIPVAAIAMGPCAGLGALKAACAHFSVMVKGTSQVMAGGPPVVERGMGSRPDKEALGGSALHTRQSGVIDNEAESEEHAFALIRRWLSYVPDSVFQMPPRRQSGDDPNRAEEALLSIIPRDRRQVYKVRRIVELVMDRDSVFEMTPNFGGSVVTCLARLDGYPVGVIANDPYKFGGGLNRPAAEKMETFVDFCDTFHLPIVNFVDQPGTVVGIEGERQGNVRGSVRVVSAIEQSKVPWCAIVIRRLFGLAGTAYARMQGINLHYAWPSGRWGSIPFEGGIAAAYRRELDGLSPEERAQRLIEFDAKYEHLASPFLTAERFRVPDIIDPRETRARLCDWVEDAYRILPEQLGPKGRTYRK